MSGRKIYDSIPFRLLPNPGSWAISSPEALFLVLTEENYQKFYPTAPKGADFIQNVYLLACWGIKPNPGYKISISQIAQYDWEVIIRIKFIEPEPPKFYPQVVTRPLMVAEVAKAALSPRGLLTFIFMAEKDLELARLETYVSP
ncbi:protease complex subunit PrcB family protein [Moorella naiadis]|uniref:protease complex subunit PrcB family protein n=1 Tax=Moorella naiadis (nom. illeg.) TaxID=3093670 RepID=UPI003D9C7F7C